jgi:signal transduction histidine kinase
MKQSIDHFGKPARGLRGKGLLMVAIPLFFEIAFALLVMSMDRAARLDHEAEIRGGEIYSSAYHLLQLLVDTETAIRGYILTGKPEFTEPYDHAIVEVPKELRKFRAVNTHTAGEVDAIERLVAPLIRHQTLQRNRVASGHRAEAVASVVSGEGKRKMDAFRVEMDRFLAHHRATEEARAHKNATTRRGLRNVILGGLLVNLCAAAAMAFYFTASITRRLGVLVANTFHLERREPLRRPLRGSDEIAQLDARFHAMGVALEKSRAELESFSYSVSHDLRAPLRAVNGYAQMVQEDYAERLDGEGKRYLTTIRAEAQRMGQLIDDLLAFSRLGRQPLQLGPIDVAAIAREALRDVPGAAETRVAVQFDPAPPALADRAMLRQVFVNLISNAIKFSSRNAEIRVDVGGSRGEAENIYWVRDRGVGFDMRFAEKLFGVFQRLHAVHEFEGTGVGLAIVHRIIDRHGGRVWVEAEEGHGACFFFSLPRPRENES